MGSSAAEDTRTLWWNRMFGTLIGVFITSAGIVLGVDSVLWNSPASGPTRIDKTCLLSPRTVAAFEGGYGDDRFLHRRFEESCTVLRRASATLSVEERADRLAGKLKQAYEARLGPVPVEAASLPAPGSRHVASVVVAGYDGMTPLVTVREIRWERSRKGKWQVVVDTGKLSFQDCGAKFIGEDGVASLLLDTSVHFAQVKQSREVRAAVAANRHRQSDSCFLSTFSVEEAKGLYRTAVVLTIDHAEEFVIQSGAVGGRLHLLTIPPDGPVQEECIDPEDYVGESPKDRPINGKGSHHDRRLAKCSSVGAGRAVIAPHCRAVCLKHRHEA